MIITISDNSEYIAKHSRHIKSDAILLDLSNYQHAEDGKKYYTSLADIPAELLLPICLKSTEIAYYPPPIWESITLEQHTEDFLKTLIDVYQLNVHGLDSYTNRTDVLELKSKRKSNDPQLWIAGCSYAVGRGLVNEDDRYGVQLALRLDMQYSNLCELSSSIDWQADQILRSDIRKSDIVTWGIPAANRTSYFINGKRWFATVNTSSSIVKDRRFFEKLITDDNIVYQSIKKVKQVINFCNKIEAKLILFYHSIGLREHNEIMIKYLSAESCFLHLPMKKDQSPGSVAHPGPLTNQLWAEKIYNFIKNESK